jgi:hypothetical protein
MVQHVGQQVTLEGGRPFASADETEVVHQQACSGRNRRFIHRVALRDCRRGKVPGIKIPALPLRQGQVELIAA